MKWLLYGAIGLAMMASAGCANARSPHPQMAQAGCCATQQQYAPRYQTPVYHPDTYQPYDDGRSDCCDGPASRQGRYQPPVYEQERQGCCDEDRRVDDRYGPVPTSRNQARGEFRVHSYGGAEQHYGDCLDRRTGQVCDCDDAFSDGYAAQRGEYYREGPRAGYGPRSMQVEPGFFYETGGVGPIPMGGYGGGGGYAVISGSGGGGSSFASSNASASAYSSSSTSINIGGFGGGMGGHGGKGGGGHPGMGGGYGGGMMGGDPGMNGHGGKGGGMMGGHGGMGGGSGD